MTRHVTAIKIEPDWSVAVLNEQNWRAAYSAVVLVKEDKYLVYSQRVSSGEYGLQVVPVLSGGDE